ncbi:MAG: carboxypeptidase-like regulatory domain-containing protein [Clostridiales bacterium]|nr:carboxypeptidase-like regulatory domain-containing protein [Clostridiales bacterium]
MEIKAKDRNEVRALLEEAKALSQKNPDDELLKVWVNKFSDLLNMAQASGENTVNGAVLRFMRIRDPKFPKATNWQEVIWKLQYYGHEILLKAEETGFVTPNIRQAAQCMINFSIRDVEGNPQGFGVYEGREGTFNIPPARDFDVDCEPRSSFSYASKGEPSKPTDLGLDWINQVRVEARWWQLGSEENDATELMEEFYEDSMCKVPPNDCGQGHRHYRQLAGQYNLPRAIKYNEGFYATIYGKVEIVSSSGRKPAKGARVTVKSPLDGESWTGDTDAEGRYEINEVLLHKECQPYEIRAQHGQDETWDMFEGPLEKPDPSYRYEKNLEIGKGDVLGRVSVSFDWAGEDSSRRTRGRASFDIVGTWKYKPEESTGHIESYRPEPLKVNYSYWERVEDVHPEQDCPALEWELKGSGRLSLPLHPLYDIFHPMGRLIVYSDIPVLGSTYEAGSVGTWEKKITIQGKERTGDYNPECKAYVPKTREITVGMFIIRAPLGPKGEMSGTESWAHCGYGGGYGWDDVAVTINHFPGLLGENKDPYDPPMIKEDCGTGTTNIKAQWNFKKIKK